MTDAPTSFTDNNGRRIITDTRLPYEPVLRHDTMQPKIHARVGHKETMTRPTDTLFGQNARIGAAKTVQHAGYLSFSPTLTHGKPGHYAIAAHCAQTAQNMAPYCSPTTSLSNSTAHFKPHRVFYVLSSPS